MFAFSFQVIAFTCCAITVFLMIGVVSTSQWVQSEGWREGLFMQCVSEGSPTPLPLRADVQKSIQIEQEKTCFSAYIKIEKKADIGKHISRFLTGV